MLGHIVRKKFYGVKALKSALLIRGFDVAFWVMSVLLASDKGSQLLIARPKCFHVKI